MRRMIKNELTLLVMTLLFFTVSCDRERAGVIQMSFGREENWQAAESCPQVELDLDMNLESDEEVFNTFDGSVNFGRTSLQSLSPTQLGIGNVDFVKLLDFPVLQSALTFFTLLGLIMGLLCTCVCIISCMTYKPKSLKKYFRPTCGVAKQWASDMSDVFVFFPCKGVYFMLHYVIMVPLRAVLAFGTSIIAARTTRLQQKLMQEAEGLQERPKGKVLKQRERGNGNCATSLGTGLSAKKGKQKVNTVVDKKKDCEVLKTASGTNISVDDLNDSSQSRSELAEDLEVSSAANHVVSELVSETLTASLDVNLESDNTANLESASTSSAITPESLVQSVLESCDGENSTAKQEESRESEQSMQESRDNEKQVQEPVRNDSSVQDTPNPPAVKGTPQPEITPSPVPQRTCADVVSKKNDETAKQQSSTSTKVQVADTPKTTAPKKATKEAKETSKKAVAVSSKATSKASVPPPSQPQAGECQESSPPTTKKTTVQASGNEVASNSKKLTTSSVAPPPPPPLAVASVTAEVNPKTLTTPQSKKTPTKDTSTTNSTVDTPSPPRALVVKSTEVSTSKAKVSPPPFPPPGLSSQPTDTVVHSKAAPQASKKHNKMRKLPHNLGPPPPGPAPAPPMKDGLILDGDGNTSTTKAGVQSQEASTKQASHNKCPQQTAEGRTRLEIWSPKSLVDNLHDNGTISGGTGCTVDFGSTSEKVIEMMAHQAQINHMNMVREQQEKAAGSDSQDGAYDSVDYMALDDILPTATDDATVDAFDDASLEAMVEDLVATTDFTAGNFCFEEDEEDAVSKMDEAYQEIEDESVVANDSGLRYSAPVFVPGQMWTGSQRSAFVD